MIGENDTTPRWQIIWPILACLFILTLAYLSMIGDH
jgi:hypothetical protein